MAKILIRKEKKHILKETGKEVTIVKFRKYYVRDTTKDFSCNEGIVKKKDLKKKDGSEVITNTGQKFIVFTSTFADDYKKIGRLAQIIPLKDVGLILAETGVGKNSIVVDAGAGSGALAIFLAQHVKKVTTYDINKKHIDIVKKNIEFLSIKNLKVKEKNVYRGIDEKKVDLITLDLPEPWNAIPSVEKALKIGGFLVSYSPTIPQVMDFVSVVSSKPSFIVLKTVELIERKWEDLSKRS